MLILRRMARRREDLIRADENSHRLSFEGKLSSVRLPLVASCNGVRRSSASRKSGASAVVKLHPPLSVLARGFDLSWLPAAAAIKRHLSVHNPAALVRFTLKRSRLR